MHTTPRIGRRLLAAAALCTAIGALASCAALAPSASLTDDNHVHELATTADGQSLLVSTHDGLFTVDLTDGEVSGPVGNQRIDLMGLTVADEALLASGHPGTSGAQELRGPNVGLIRSDDHGESWDAVSLEGVADFHALTYDPEAQTIIGSHAAQLYISEDMGSTWREGAATDAYDLLATDQGLLMTSFAGLSRSLDGGGTFEPVSGAPALVLLGGSGDAVVGVDQQGALWQSGPDERWNAGGTTPEQIFALTQLPDGDVVVAGASGLQRTSDRGQTWQPLLT
ncbi:WD40/YVTN/BNR-like repeat-containing protein [Agrococcus beijingensis]|uniref:WD40/YVTN/BNR-like repeat-containing protein n=1 Tax=Agrococcus beijingensis TaxID=3068634 RepID=UPI00274201FE|nr:sialidase family protein [Agrococcus sp. REN33]